MSSRRLPLSNKAFTTKEDFVWHLVGVQNKLISSVKLLRTLMYGFNLFRCQGHFCTDLICLAAKDTYVRIIDL